MPILYKRQRWRQGKSEEDIKGRKGDLPNMERYSEKVSTQPEHEARRQHLQKALDQFMAIPQEFGEKAGGASNGKTKKKKKDR